MKKGIVLIGISFLISKILGLVRDNLLAAGFGASQASGIFNLDSYYAAFRLPDLLFNLMSYGILSSAFVPIFVEILQKKGKSFAFAFSNEILHVIGGAIVVMSIILFIFARPLVNLFVPGFKPDELQLTANLTRLMLITPFFFTIGSIAGGIQNSLNKFLGLALAPVFYNLGIVFGILFLSRDYGVYGVAIGVVFGAFMNMAVQLPGILEAGFCFAWPGKIWTSRVKEMLILSFPRIIGMSISQFSLIIDTIIASTLASGSIVIINFATNLESLPLGLIGISIAVVSFGTLSSHAASGNTEEFKNEIVNNIRKILFLLIPLTLGMFTLRYEIVRLLLLRGKFLWSDAVFTSNTLGLLLGGLAFGGILFLLARAFYALKDTKTPVLVGLIAVCVNIAASLTFTKILHLGTYGLAMSNALASLINTSLLVLLLNKRLKIQIIDALEILKFIIAAIVMAAAVEFAKYSLTNVFAPINIFWGLVLQIFVYSSIGAICYFLICRLLHCKEKFMI